MRLVAALLIAVAIVAAGALIGGRYQTVSVSNNGVGIVYITDRFTGDVRVCAAGSCKQLSLDQTK